MTQLTDEQVAAMDETFRVPWTPTEAMWSGLARQIMMWLDFSERRTPANLLKHLERSGVDVPTWLREEPEMQHLDHSISKGTRCVLIYRAMLHDHRAELLKLMTELGEQFDGAAHAKGEGE